MDTSIFYTEKDCEATIRVIALKKFSTLINEVYGIK